MRIWLVTTDKGQTYAFSSKNIRDEWLKEVYEQAKSLTKGWLDVSYDEYWGDLILEEVNVIG